MSNPLDWRYPYLLSSDRCRSHTQSPSFDELQIAMNCLRRRKEDQRLANNDDAEFGLFPFGAWAFQKVRSKAQPFSMNLNRDKGVMKLSVFGCFTFLTAHTALMAFAWLHFLLRAAEHFKSGCPSCQLLAESRPVSTLSELRGDRDNQSAKQRRPSDPQRSKVRRVS